MNIFLQLEYVIKLLRKQKVEFLNDNVVVVKVNGMQENF